MSCIYALLHPATGEVRYVGKTKQPNPRVRLLDHIRLSAKGIARQRKLCCWMRSLPEHPKMEILEHDPADINEAERRWIAHFKSIGLDLCNMTTGGDGQEIGYCPTEETRKKLSQSTLNRSMEWRIKLSNALRGQKRSPEQRARQSASSMGKAGTFNGRKHSEETRQKMSESMKLAYVEGRKSVAMTVHTEEAKQRISDGMKLAYAEGRKQPVKRRIHGVVALAG
jgi:hypothetical protein